MESNGTDVIQVAGKAKEQFTLAVVEYFDNAIITGTSEKRLGRMKSARSDWAYLERIA